MKDLFMFEKTHSSFCFVHKGMSLPCSCLFLIFLPLQFSNKDVRLLMDMYWNSSWIEIIGSTVPPHSSKVIGLVQSSGVSREPPCLAGCPQRSSVSSYHPQRRRGCYWLPFGASGVLWRTGILFGVNSHVLSPVIPK